MLAYNIQTHPSLSAPAASHLTPHSRVPSTLLPPRPPSPPTARTHPPTPCHPYPFTTLPAPSSSPDSSPSHHSNSLNLLLYVSQPPTPHPLWTPRSPIEIYREEPTFLICELLFITTAILSLVHALRYRGRYLWLWNATIAHGLMTECLSYFYPPIDNFWHAQSTVMMFGQREPLHIILLYPAFIYPANVAVARLGLTENVQVRREDERITVYSVVGVLSHVL